jgi:hypothetical protein
MGLDFICFVCLCSALPGGQPPAKLIPELRNLFPPHPLEFSTEISKGEGFRKRQPPLISMGSGEKNILEELELR